MTSGQARLATRTARYPRGTAGCWCPAWYAMPRCPLGYGFPVGGVAATDVARGGVVSPRGVGFDIACGVRLLAVGLSRDELLPVLGRVIDQLAAVTPCGAGRGGLWDLHGRAEMDKLLAGGAGYAVACGHGGQRDLDRCEDHGVTGDADLAQVSSRAIDRGLHQAGSLGSGNTCSPVARSMSQFTLSPRCAGQRGSRPLSCLIRHR